MLNTNYNILSLSNISKRFGSIFALNNVNLDIKAGEVLAIVGDNGAGKSTLVKIISGVHSPTSGNIKFCGNNVTMQKPRDALDLGIATVFQDLALCENLDVVSNVFLGQESTILNEASMEIETLRLLKNLSSKVVNVRNLIASLSGGQRQTVAIVRSLLLKPKIIILDEPTAALGVPQTKEVLNLIRKVRDNGIGVIMISHNMDDVLSVADKIAVLRLGKNNGLFTTDVTRAELVQAITGDIKA